MPLPTGNPTWPPEDTRQARELYATWGAWYSGDPTELAQVYGPGLTSTSPDRKPPHQTGILGRAARAVVRWFWGQPTSPAQAPSRIHVPLASAIAEASSQLLFEEMPTITATSQDRLDEIIEESGLHATLQEAAEVCAAYGGVYLRASWDTTLADVPLTDAIPPDAAAPEWAHGRLTAVTFWREVDEDHGHVWRHLERHEPGQVLHGLYRGTRDKLGRQLDLADHPATAGLADQVDESGAIPTGIDGLAVVYVPNVLPNRIMRGSPLGRSDYSGIEPVLDLLDESWSAWARELRLAKARAVVPNFALEDQGAGQGAYFDEDREIWSGLEMLSGQDATPSQMVQLIQPEIRVDELSRTCAEVAKQAVRGAGYSAPGIAEEGDGQAVTATEIHDRKGRSLQTRARKIGYWRPQLAHYIEILLGIDAAVWPGSGATPERPSVEWPDAVTPDPEAISRTLTGIANAEAASTKTKVAMLHPDWSEDAVAEEVDRIQADRTSEVDPLADVGASLAGTGVPTDGPEGAQGEA